MPTPRYVPRSFCVTPSRFGSIERPEWRTGDQTSFLISDQLGASQLQHKCAFAIRQRAMERFGSITEFASVAGVNGVRMGRVLRGEIVMKLEDLATAERVLGELFR
jgi:hypothetical protein